MKTVDRQMNSSAQTVTMLQKIFKFLAFYSFLCLFCLLGVLFYKNNEYLRFSKPAGDEPQKEKYLDKVPKNFWSKEAPRVRLETTTAPTAEALQPCPDTSPHLVGPLHVEFETKRTLDQVREQVGSVLQLGGRYKPPDCVSKQKVAIIVPFRNRYEHLNHWLYYLHHILIRQQVDYGVYVINQDGDGVYNKAKLMNAGYVEALKEYDYDCFVFSDVDLVPLDDRNLYRCFDTPRHLAVAIDKFNFELPYEQIFGGVTSLSKEHFLKVNGFSNTYWGWGGEDDDIYNRIMFRIKSISRPDHIVGRYKMIKHERDVHNERNLKNVAKLQESQKTLDQDGLNTLSYTVKEIRKDRLFTFITVDVHIPQS